MVQAREMALLVTESECEARATLREALAFVEAFEAEVEMAATCSADDVAAPQRAPPMKTAKKRSHTERIKAEMESLRRDAEALEVVLRQMQENASSKKQLVVRPTARRRDPRMANWLDLVVEECQRRRQSEALNHQLRAMLTKQVDLMQASVATLSFKFSDADLNALYGPQRHHDLAKSLSSRSRQLQMNVDDVLRRTGLARIDSLHCWSQREHDDNVGVLFESTFCLPVPFTFEQTHQAFASLNLSTSGTEMGLKEEFDTCQFNSTQVEHQQQTHDLAIKGSLRSLVQEDCVIYIWTAQVSLSSKQWTFLEDSLFVVRRSNASSSLLQNWHRACMEEQGAPTVSDPLKETILRCLSLRGRDCLRIFKSSMMSKSRR